MRAAVYVRVSTDEAAREGISLDVQEADCTARALDLGAVSVTVYRDEGLSGSRWDRPRLQALLAALPTLDLVVAWDLSRLSRTLEHQLIIMRTLAESGVRLVCLQQEVSTDTAAGRLGVNVLGAVGQFQREQIVENVRAALDRLARVDGIRSGAAPFGYVGAGRETRPHPANAETVRELYRRAARGETLGSLLRWLNSSGVPPVRGERWGYTTLRRVLSNPFYRGLLPHHGELLPGKHTAIVPAATWRRVQERLAQNAPIHPRARSASWSSLYRCGHCGAAISTHGAGKGSSPAVYRCSVSRHLPPEARHASIATTAPKADEHLWRAVAACISDGTLERAAEMIRRRQATRAQAGREDKLERAVADGEARLAENLRLYHRGLLTEAVLARENAALTSEVTQARVELEALRSAQVTRRQAADWQRVIGGEGRGLLERLTREQRREYLRRVTARVLLTHNRLEVRWALPDLPMLVVDLPERWGRVRG